MRFSEHVRCEERSDEEIQSRGVVQNCFAALATTASRDPL